MENREMIMRCAKTLFYAKGYDAVGVQEIVDKAGVTKPTLYYYFGSKYGLLKTLIEEMKAEIAEAQRLKDLGEGDGRPLEEKQGKRGKKRE